MHVALFMFTADGQRRRFPLQRDITVIGRREDCDLRIPLTEVSRKHCRLVNDANGLRLEDLGSSNGTFHNGNRVRETVVEPGDRVQVGPVLFIVQIDGIPADDAVELPKADAADSSSLGGQAAADDGIPSSTTQATRSPTKRPAAPQGEDFLIAGDDKKSDEDELVDLADISPSPKNDKR
jgi:pSer/pThr/pTyr-binding forkhead associated (FHA) protein